MNLKELSGHRRPVSALTSHRHRHQCHLPNKVSILGVSIDNLSAHELLQQLDRGVVFTPNVDHVMKLRKDASFAAAYKKADFRICDSQILMYAAKFLKTPFKEKISGSDFFPIFCNYHKSNEAIKIFILGGAHGVPQKAQENINDRTGREIVVGAHSPPFEFEKDPAENERLLNLIRQSGANVVVVCLGTPKQEKWIAEHCDRLPGVDIFMGVGATVDFEAGNKRRAPQWLSELGLEWLWRLMIEPRRLWKRYILDDLPFIWLLLRQKLTQ